MGLTGLPLVMGYDRAAVDASEDVDPDALPAPEPEPEPEYEPHPKVWCACTSTAASVPVKVQTTLGGDPETVAWLCPDCREERHGPESEHTPAKAKGRANPFGLTPVQPSVFTPSKALAEQRKYVAELRETLKIRWAELRAMQVEWDAGRGNGDMLVEKSQYDAFKRAADDLRVLKEQIDDLERDINAAEQDERTLAAEIAVAGAIEQPEGFVTAGSITADRIYATPILSTGNDLLYACQHAEVEEIRAYGSTVPIRRVCATCGAQVGLDAPNRALYPPL
jgi:hypothetical protein